MASGIRRHTNTDGKRGIKSNIGYFSISDTLENIDREPGAEATGPEAFAGYIESSKSCGHLEVVRKGHYAKATTGRAEANATIFGAYVEGPCAEAHTEAAHINVNKTEETLFSGFSVGAEASAFKAGVQVGPLITELNINVNTGISVTPTTASINFLGYGYSVGPNPSINTPLGKIAVSF